MSNEAKEQLLESVYAAWRAKDVEALAGCFTDDCVYEDMAMGVVNKGKEQLREFIAGVYATMPDFHVVYTKRFATEQFGAGQWVISATWQGEFEGVDCSGTAVEFTGLSYYEFKGHRIHLAQDCWDLNVLRKCFGLL